MARGRDRLSALDRSDLRTEASGAPMHVGVLALVQSAPLRTAEGELRLDDLRRRLADRAPRGLRQVPVRRTGLPRRWRTVPIDPARHVRVVAVPGADERALLDTCTALVQEPFPPDRPPWEVVVLPGTADGRVGVLVRLAHVLGDGIAAVELLAPLFDEDDAAAVGRAVSLPSGRRRGVLGLLALLRVRAVELATMLGAAARPSPSFNRPVGTRRRLLVARVPFAPLRAAAHAASAAIDDLLLDATAAGAHALLEARGELRRTPRLVVSVAATLRRPGRRAAGRNRAGVLPVPIPVGVGEEHADRRLAAIARADRRIRGAPAAQPSGRLLQRWMAAVMSRQRLVHLLLSNVPGSSRPLHLLGAAVEELLPIGLVQGDIPITVLGLSYAGGYAATVLVDPDAVPDADVFGDAFTRRITALAG